MGNYTVYITSLLIFWFSGIIGVLVDLDHIPYLLGIEQETRPTHFAIGVIGCVIMLFIISYFGGLYIKLVLRSKDD